MGDIIRKLTNDDFDVCMNLGMYAFKVTFNKEEYENRRALCLNDKTTLLGMFHDDKLCSQLLIFHMQFSLQGKFVPAGGIALVSTWPEYRRKGYVAQLLNEALLQMKNNGQFVSVLHPFSVPFYRKYGYELMYQKVTNRMSINNIQKSVNKGHIKRVSNVEATQFIYQNYAKQFNGMANRDYSPFLWDRKRKSFTVIYYNEQQEQTGYMIYVIDNQLFKIIEYVALDKEAKNGLWSFVAQHDSMVTEVEFESAYDDHTFFDFHDPRFKREVVQYGMARIVDCKAFIKHYTFKLATTDERYLIQIEDSQATWNNGLFELNIRKDGQAILQELYEVEHQDANVLRCSINTLTSVLFGYQTLSECLWNSTIEGESVVVNRFSERIPNSTVRLFDYF